MDDADAADDLALIEAAAREAGAIARRHFRRDPEIWEKDGGAGPVTEADLAIDAMLKADLRAARPDYGWLSEETEDDPARLAHERIFIVDPIDGTRAFIKGDTRFCIAIAVVDAGVLTAAVAFQPIEQRLFAARRGAGAFRDGERLAASGRLELEGAATLCGAPQLDAKHWPGGAPPVARAQHPSLVLRHCSVADASVDATLTLRPAWEWDMAAGDLIASEAGAIVTDRTGARHAYNAPGGRMNGALAANPTLHSALRARLAPQG